MAKVWVPLMNVVSATTQAVSDAFTVTPGEPDGPGGELEHPARTAASRPAPATAQDLRAASDTDPTVEQRATAPAVVHRHLVTRLVRPDRGRQAAAVGGRRLAD